MKKEPGYADKVAALRKHIAGPLYELYDLNVDPNEETDLIDARADKQEELMPLLEERKRATQTARKNGSSEISYEALSAEALDALNKLGYDGTSEDE